MKTAWIFPGGSARSVYTAGAIYALCKMNIPRPDMIIAASGSAPTILCYVTGQYEIIKRVWLESLSTRKFVNFLRFWKIVDIDYLIDIVLKKENPLDFKKMRESDIEIYFPLANSRTGKIEYVSSRTQEDMWEVLRATVSVPVLTNLFSFKGKFIEGKFLSDSVPTSRYQLHIQKAIEEGAERVIVFDNWHPRDTLSTYFFSKLFACLRNSQFRENQLRYIKEIRAFVNPTNIDFIKISPREKLSMGRYEINNGTARKIFQRGYDDTLNSDKLKMLT